jgi:hypothetical protein
MENQLKEEIMIPYLENVMKRSHAPGCKHLLETLRKFVGIENGTDWEEKIDKADCEGRTDWKYWKEKTDKWWW